MLRAAVPALAERISEAAPEVIVIVLKKIARPVKAAIAMAGIDVPTCVLPFPGQGWEREVVDQLLGILREQAGAPGG